MTNREWLHSLSDEQLADVICSRTFVDNGCVNYEVNNVIFGDINSKLALTTWLSSERLPSRKCKWYVDNTCTLDEQSEWCFCEGEKTRCRLEMPK